MRLKDKVSVITGAGAGIGKATALRFAQEGAKVVVADVDDKAGEEVVRQIKQAGKEAIFIHTDVSRSEDCRLLMEKTCQTFERIDILVNNAGIYVKGDVASTTEEDWKRILSVNVEGIFYCSRHAVPYMVKAGGGSIVNVGSEAGLVGIKNQLAYNVSKAAAIMMAKSMAIDHASQNIRVNAVCPGTTETPLVKAAIEQSPDPAEARKALESCRPANRLGRPEEIASAILFMASDEPGYATGSSLVIDGGMTAW